MSVIWPMGLQGAEPERDVWGRLAETSRKVASGKVIALARVDVTHAEIGTEIEVGQLDGLQKRLKATVVRFPHFDPTKERVKGNYA